MIPLIGGPMHGHPAPEGSSLSRIKYPIGEGIDYIEYTRQVWKHEDGQVEFFYTAFALSALEIDKAVRKHLITEAAVAKPDTPGQA